MNLYGLFILGINIKYILFSILYWHTIVPIVFRLSTAHREREGRSHCTSYTYNSETELLKAVTSSGTQTLRTVYTNRCFSHDLSKAI